MGENFKFNLLTLLVGVCALFVGFFLNALLGPKSSNSVPIPLSNNQNPPAQNLPAAKNQSFDTQTASSKGMILEAKDGNVKISKNNQVSTYPLARDFVIYSFEPGSKVASASSDIKKIPVNKEAQMLFEQKDGNYELKTITILPTSTK